MGTNSLFEFSFKDLYLQSNLNLKPAIIFSHSHLFEDGENGKVHLLARITSVKEINDRIHVVLDLKEFEKENTKPLAFKSDGTSIGRLESYEVKFKGQIFECSFEEDDKFRSFFSLVEDTPFTLYVNSNVKVSFVEWLIARDVEMVNSLSKVYEIIEAGLNLSSDKDEKEYLKKVAEVFEFDLEEMV